MENRKLNRKFWQGKRVFLTGHTGFKGGWLCLWLQQLGAEVTGYSLPPSMEWNLYEVADVAHGMRSVIADLRDADMLKKAMREARPEVVIHLAAQPLVRYSYAHPVETYATNVMGLVHLLEAVRGTDGVRAVINVTSDKCYENKEWAWGYRENESMGGYDPYSSSKGCSELITAAYRNSYFSPEKYAEHGTALASARAGNVIGGGDWAADRIVPDMMRAIRRGDVVRVRNPAAIRPWQHVLEPLSGYLLLAEALVSEGTAFAEGWNFGPPDADVKPVSWIIECITQIWGQRAAWVLDSMPHPHEATFLRLDCSKANSRLGWRPRWDIGTALEKVVEWHRAFDREENMHRITLDQITTYQNC